MQINRILKLFNLRIDTLTAETLEAARLASLVRSGHFARPIFPLMRAFELTGEERIVAGLNHYRSRFDDFERPSRNDVGYSFDNEYFTSPDAEVLYTIVREFQPGAVIEVGSGNSTKIIRQAVQDGDLNTRLIAIDPEPRTEIGSLVDEVYRTRVEALDRGLVFRSFRAGDILFIDSSHTIKSGNDVVFLYLIVLPDLPPGALIHIHDVFLPYEYPREWVVEERFEWNEQYLIQALLRFANAFEVLWAGHYLQRTRASFDRHFPHLNGGIARSLWLRKVT